MNLSTVKLLVSGMLLLFLSACAPYHQTYYSAGGAYSSYGVAQRSYYGSYAYRYDNHAYHCNGKYRMMIAIIPTVMMAIIMHPSWNNGQHQRPDDRRNQIKEQRHYEHRNDSRDRHVNHEQARVQSERRVRQSVAKVQTVRQAYSRRIRKAFRPKNTAKELNNPLRFHGENFTVQACLR